MSAYARQTDAFDEEQPHFTARRFARPRVVLSQCLELEAVRHDGQRIADPFVRSLMEFVELVPVCPEVSIGLGVPRDTIRLVDDEGSLRLMQPSTGADLTGPMSRFARHFVDGLEGIDGFILKSGSPSCGTRQVKVYGGIEKAPGVGRDAGLFAQAVLERFGDLAVEDEGRLRNYPIRHHFLTQLFSFAEVRQIGEAPTAAKLVDFQRRYKHLLLVYDEPRMRELGRVVAGAGRAPQESIQERFAAYAQIFRRALAEQPERRTNSNALQHMFGHFSDQLNERERDEFLHMVDEFRAQQLPLHALVSVLRSWCARFGDDYLADQTFLEPYPRELVMQRDSGKGVEF